MSITKVDVNDYGSGQKANNGRLTVSEFAGKAILSIRNDDGTVSRVEVYFDDLFRAWQAVKR